MKKRFLKFLVLTIAVFLSVLFIAPATAFAQDGEPEEPEVPEPFCYIMVSAGQPGEETLFQLGAGTCQGFHWQLIVDGDVVEGDIGVEEDWWEEEIALVLEAGDYEAVLQILEGENVVLKESYSFSVWAHETSLRVKKGYAGKDTTFYLNAADSLGRWWNLTILKEEGEVNTYWEFLEGYMGSINSDPWSKKITSKLSEGNYLAIFEIDGSTEDTVDFSIEKYKEKPEKKEKPKPKPWERTDIGYYEKTNTGFTTLFYSRFFCRPPDQAGLDAWVAGLESGAITGADLVNGFVFGEECQARISDYTDSEFITFLYKVLFNREPGTEGYNAWLARMSAGMTREEVVDGFTHSEEFVNLCKEFGIIPYEGYISTTE